MEGRVRIGEFLDRVEDIFSRYIAQVKVRQRNRERFPGSQYSPAGEVDVVGGPLRGLP